MSEIRKRRHQIILFELNKFDVLKPFVVIWSKIVDLFEDINNFFPKIDPVFEIHFLLTNEIKKNGLMTEELFVHWLIGLNFLKKNVVCKKTGHVWEPLSESFISFREKAQTITLSSVTLFDDKVNQFHLWISNEYSKSSNNLTKIILH
jgi:hypothetical protein